jgi:hypothetical protein
MLNIVQKIVSELFDGTPSSCYQLDVFLVKLSWSWVRWDQFGPDIYNSDQVVHREIDQEDC